MFGKKKGFTLLELMIVVIIIGILASLAIPRFLVARDRAIKSEAENMLGALRGAQVRYALQYDDKYATGGIAAGDTFQFLDVRPSDTAPINQTRYFTFTGANNTSGNTYVALATGEAGTAMAGKTVQITAAGVLSSTGF